MEPLLTPEELAEFLGVDIRTLYAWHANGNGPPVTRCGKYLRYRPEGVRRWMEENTDEDAEQVPA